MEDTQPLSARTTPKRRSRSSARWRSVWKVGGILFLLLFCATAGGALALLGRFYGTNPFGGITKLFGAASALKDPRKAFPGQDRITLLCLGLDRNILISKDPKLNGMPYTKGARSDVMMIASLDLVNQSVSILSVPRDTRVRLPGRRSYSKINEAHAAGGVPYTRETVEEFLGIKLDYHVVIKQEAILGVVNALGGVPLHVEKDMKYDDNWGNLHIDLREGQQTLNGEQLVGYMRFRKDNEGDLGRIRRQQQVIQSLSGQVKNPAVLTKAYGLIGAVRKYIDTDLTPDQQLALATLFHKVRTENVVTASLPIADDNRTIGGVSYLVVDEERKAAAVDWILRGNKDAMNRMIRVEVRNASGDPELAQQTYNCLRHYGFVVWRGRRASGDPQPVTRVVQHGTLKGSGRRVLEVLGVGGNVEKAEGEGPDVTLYVGQDLQSSQVLALSDLWPPVPQASDTSEASESGEPTRSARRRRRSQERVPVRVRRVDEENASTEDAGPADVPGAADPETTSDPVPAPEPASAGAPATPEPPAIAPSAE